MKKYPMNYEEFEKRVIELYIEEVTTDNLQSTKYALEALKRNLEEEPDFIYACYESECSYYDDPEISEGARNRIFTDDGLLSQPYDS